MQQKSYNEDALIIHRQRYKQLFRTIVKTNGSGGLSGSMVSRFFHSSAYTSCTQSRASSRLRSKLYASAYIFPLNGKYICVNCSCPIGVKTFLVSFYVSVNYSPSNPVPPPTSLPGSLYVIRLKRQNLTINMHFFALIFKKCIFLLINRQKFTKTFA